MQRLYNIGDDKAAEEASQDGSRADAGYNIGGNKVPHNVSLYIILGTVEQVEIMMSQRLLLHIILATTRPLKKQAKMGVVPMRDITLAAIKCNDWGTSRNRLMLENDDGHRSGDIER